MSQPTARAVPWVLLGLAAGALGLTGAIPPAGADQEQPTTAVVAVPAGNLLELGDGTLVRLAGLHVPSAATAPTWSAAGRRELERLMLDREITRNSDPARLDRYGRQVAQIERDDGLWLQGTLLEQGLAQVRTEPGAVARVREMLAREAVARASGLGLWADPRYRPRPAAAVADTLGRFRIVYGRVVRVAPTKRFLYLNFGADWRSDFTVRIRLRDRKQIFGERDPDQVAGQVVEVRGVVIEAGGPLVEVTHAEQLRTLPAMPEQ